MQSDFTESNYRSSFNDSTNQLEWTTDELMHQFHPFWKYILLNDNQSKMTGTQVARTILRERGRTDVKVCLSQDQRNCYSPLLNLIGLSKDVAGSRSVIAAAVAAHEVGHVLQPEALQEVDGALRKLHIYHLLATLGELFLLVPWILNQMPRVLKSIPSSGSQVRNQNSIRRCRIHQFQQKLQYFRLINPQHLSHLLSVLKLGIILLFIPIRFLVTLGFGVLFLILVNLIIPPSICCALIRRWLIFLTELHASL